MALVLCDKFKGGNEARVAEALRRTKPGAMIVLAGAKEDGIEALRKRVAKLGVACDHMPKYHGQAVWFVRPDNADALAATLAPEPSLIEGRFRTAPGVFSYSEVDAGSELLAGRLPTDLDGAAADLGAGWGYLSVMLADASPRLKSSTSTRPIMRRCRWPRAIWRPSIPGLPRMPTGMTWPARRSRRNTTSSS